MIYQQSKSDKEQTEQLQLEKDLLKYVADGTINGDNAIDILSSIFPTNYFTWTQQDVEDFLCGVYKLHPAEIDKVMESFPDDTYNFPDYDRNSPR